MIRVQHFSDVLCVWAYVAQIRADELAASFGDSVGLDYHFVDVFGDVSALEARWRDRGGLAAYGDHVREVAARFDHVAVHDDVWRTVRPQSSMGCHLFLRAVDLLDVPDAMSRAAARLRRQFFEHCADVSARQTQLEIAEALQLDRAAIEAHLHSGRAHAMLSRDLRLARELSVTMSPTFVCNEGRQRLAGNVGYRVIEANVREWLANPADRASWC